MAKCSLLQHALPAVLLLCLLTLPADPVDAIWLKDVRLTCIVRGREYRNNRRIPPHPRRFGCWPTECRCIYGRMRCDGTACAAP